MTTTNVSSLFSPIFQARQEAQLTMSAREAEINQIFEELLAFIKQDQESMCSTLKQEGFLQLQILFKTNNRYDGKLADTQYAYTYDIDNLTLDELSLITEKFKTILYPKQADVKWKEEQGPRQQVILKERAINLFITKNKPLFDFEFTHDGMRVLSPNNHTFQHEAVRDKNEFCQKFYQAEKEHWDDMGDSLLGIEVVNKISERNASKDAPFDKVIELLQQQQNVEYRVIFNSKDKEPGNERAVLQNATTVSFFAGEYRLIDLVHIINRLVQETKKDTDTLWEAAFSETWETYKRSGTSINKNMKVYKELKPRTVFSMWLSGKKLVKNPVTPTVDLKTSNTSKVGRI